MSNSGSASDINNYLLNHLAGPRQDVANNSAVPPRRGGAAADIIANNNNGSSDPDYSMHPPPDDDGKSDSDKDDGTDDKLLAHQAEQLAHAASNLSLVPPLPTLPLFNPRPAAVDMSHLHYEMCIICRGEAFAPETGGAVCANKVCPARVCRICVSSLQDQKCPCCRSARLQLQIPQFPATAVDANTIATMRAEHGKLNAKLRSEGIAPATISMLHLNGKLNKFRGALYEAEKFAKQNPYDNRCARLILDAQVELHKAELNLLPQMTALRRYLDLEKALTAQNKHIAKEEKTHARFIKKQEKAQRTEFVARQGFDYSIALSSPSDYDTQVPDVLINGDGYVNGVYLGNGS